MNPLRRSRPERPPPSWIHVEELPTGATTRRGEGTSHFHLTAHLRNGVRRRLLKNLHSREEGEVLAEWIGYGLALGTVPA